MKRGRGRDTACICCRYYCYFCRITCIYGCGHGASTICRRPNATTPAPRQTAPRRTTAGTTTTTSTSARSSAASADAGSNARPNPAIEADIQINIDLGNNFATRGRGAGHPSQRQTRRSWRPRHQRHAAPHRCDPYRSRHLPRLRARSGNRTRAHHLYWRCGQPPARHRGAAQQPRHPRGRTYLRRSLADRAALLRPRHA